MYKDDIGRYRDCSPETTVSRIKDTLQKLGIITEEHWTNTSGGYYALDIFVFGTNLIARGKGITPGYALASGYGELMEKIQNFSSNDVCMYADSEASQYGGFIHAPDEKRIGLNEIMEHEEDWKKVFSLKTEDENEENNILMEWIAENGFGKPSELIVLPFLNLEDNTIHYLPKVFVDLIYGSNGMCVGNTPEEALVHGLSEIMAGYARRKIRKDNVVPPAIPQNYLEQFPGIYRMMKDIVKRGKFQFVVKDCSLGEELPVVAVIFTDLDHHTCSVSFGAHPVFEAAVEKCLTGLFQDINLNDMSGMNSFSYYCEGQDNKYSPEFFIGNPSYPFKGFNSPGKYDNGFLAAYLSDMLIKKGYDILTRDISFLGFPGYQVIVPFFSEIYDMDIKTVKSCLTAIKVGKTLKNLMHSTNEELQEAVNYMHQGGIAEFTSQDSIVKALGLPMTDDSPLHEFKRDMFTAFVYYKAGFHKKAYDAMDDFIRSIDNNHKDALITYYKAVRDYFGIRADGIDDEKRIKRLLGVFYPENTVVKTIEEFGNPSNVFRNCASLKCFNCSECEYTSYCRYPKNRQLYMKLKDIYAKCNIDQRRTINIVGTEKTAIA